MSQNTDGRECDPRRSSARHGTLLVRRRGWWLPFLCVWLGLSHHGFTTATEEVDLSRFEKQTVGPGDLIQPMELDIAPDGRIFLIELAGIVKLIDPRTNESKVVGKLEVTTAQENGLIGLALDPNFAENGWVYLQYSPPDFSGQHVSRFRFVDEHLDLASEQLLFKYEEQRRECCHHAGSLEFGPDGTLYIGTGDNTNPFDDSQGFAPIDQRPGREPWDAQRTSGNTKNYNGKILRIRPEADGTYSIPDGNLFPKDGSLGHPEIYVMGCRNPWRINVDRRTGFLYWGDVGPDAGADGPRGPRGYDEVNQARQAGFFGWPYFIGDNYAYPLVDFATGEIHPPMDPQQPFNDSVNNTGTRELPPAKPAMLFYPVGPSDRFPQVGSGGRTACAGPVYYFDERLDSSTKFPAAYNRTLFAFEWSRNWILAVHLDENSHVERLEPFLPEMSFVRPIDMQFDAYGSLYVIEYGETWGVNPDARLVRIDYVRGNRTPVAKAQAKTSVGREPLKTQFTSDGTFDKDDDPLAWEWSYVFAGIEQPERVIFAQTATAEHTFTQPGVYTVELQVTDSNGATASTSLPVIVGNSRPEVTFLKPSAGDFYDPGATIRYELLVRDMEDGTSDFDELDDEGGLHPIEAAAPTRLLVEAIGLVPAGAAEESAPGLALMRKSDCFNCHATNRPLVGPSLVQIADKYRDLPHHVEESVKRVTTGSTGVWGNVAMLPHSQHTAAEVRQMVEYVYSLSSDNANPTAQGFRNELTIPDAMAPGVRMEATYTDLGRGDIPRLSGVATVDLRSRTLQAEDADQFAGTQKLHSANAQGNQFMGAIEHDGYLRFANIRFDQIGSLLVRVASAGAGGEIEVRYAAKDGPLVGHVSVEVNGQWEEFYEKTFPIQLPPEASEAQADMFIVFKNAERRGGLMNVDSLICLPSIAEPTASSITK
jgi:cytochrome c